MHCSSNAQNYSSFVKVRQRRVVKKQSEWKKRKQQQQQQQMTPQQAGQRWNQRATMSGPGGGGGPQQQQQSGGGQGWLPDPVPVPSPGGVPRPGGAGLLGAYPGGGPPQQQNFRRYWIYWRKMEAFSATSFFLFLFDKLQISEQKFFIGGFFYISMLVRFPFLSC